jgi:TonB family protein
MTLLTGKRIGQSRAELKTAVTFSLVIHIVTISGALLLSMYARPRMIVPPTYRVNLVNLPADAPLLPPSMSTPPSLAPPAETPTTKAPSPSEKGKQPSLVPMPAAPAKNAMPELGAEKQKKEPVAEVEQPRAEATGATGRRGEAVAVTSETPEFRFPPYVAIVRDKVERNWNPPPGAKGAKVKVVFRILRSGRVGDTRLTESSGNFYFDQAAMRAILSSSPFPPLPEGFFKDSEVFSVDLVERE